mmetsp:Transcript_77504/g.185835  ORF Transcript_77504/g.185835 Transcript_77504/m.185835 type:complete len:233 (+) Transcript_77504:1649-2347(+)
MALSKAADLGSGAPFGLRRPRQRGVPGQHHRGRAAGTAVHAGHVAHAGDPLWRHHCQCKRRDRVCWTQLQRGLLPRGRICRRRTALQDELREAPLFLQRELRRRAVRRMPILPQRMCCSMRVQPVLRASHEGCGALCGTGRQMGGSSKPELRQRVLIHADALRDVQHRRMGRYHVWSLRQRGAVHSADSRQQRVDICSFLRCVYDLLQYVHHQPQCWSHCGQVHGFEAVGKR